MQKITDNTLMNQYADSSLPDDEIHLRQSGRIYIVLSVGLLSLLWFNADAEIQTFHKLLGLFIGILTLAPSYQWIKLKDKSIPFIELISFHNFLIYCPPIFLGSVKFVGATQSSIIQDDDLTKLLLLIILGILCLFIGYYVIRLPKIKAIPTLDIDWDRAIPFFLIYLGISAIGPILVPRLPSALFKVGELVFSVNGSVTTYALALLAYKGELSPKQRKIFFAELVLFLTICLSSGWLNAFVFPMAAFFIGVVQAQKKLPWIKMIFVFLLIIILQMSKQTFREEYWGEKMGGQSITSVTQSISRSKRWLEMAFSDIGSIGKGAAEVAQVRVNHLSFFGHVVFVTPKYIPYLDGYSYKYIPAMFIPRFLWPDKPSTMKITNELAMRYGWLSDHFIGKVALSPGLMDEAYMNFGIIGVMVVMILFGAIIRCLMDNLGNDENGFGWQLTLVGFIFGGGLMVTWTAPSYLGGLWQTIFIIAVLYWPLRVKS
ncbi:MAG: hypothetical protein GY749_35870 [Desulfobacteraceae bacterium]|nr:hypothetical protein [Desulfobacteraceae bacterium]